MAYSKQKKIVVMKAVSNKNNIYGIFNKEAMFKAMKNLTSNGFKLWCYFNVNQDRYKLELSSIDVKPKCNIGKTTYYKTIKELIEKGYLVEVEDVGKNCYVFMEGGTK